MTNSFERNKTYLDELQKKSDGQEEPLLSSNFSSSQKIVKTPRTTDEFVNKRWEYMGYEQPPEALYNESDKALIETYK